MRIYTPCFTCLWAAMGCQLRHARYFSLRAAPHRPVTSAILLRTILWREEFVGAFAAGEREQCWVGTRYLHTLHWVGLGTFLLNSASGRAAFRWWGGHGACLHGHNAS